MILTVVVQELGDQVYMGQDHASAAVALEAKLIKSLAKSELASDFKRDLMRKWQNLPRSAAVLLKQIKVLVPLVTNDLTKIKNDRDSLFHR